ncbi:MAG TPA: RagB/SusD family nutrient uptake outer membrane protein, partial [Longimicrobiales bacterium]|nr:RagB/SusD family nutrient uptake outer membrane protein [Longimicrobiales bacterium]
MTKRSGAAGVRKRHGPVTRGVAVAGLLGGLLLAGCADFEITDPNAPTVESLTENPTRSILARTATGIFADAFNNIGTEIQYYALYGREGYNLQNNDPRETGEQIRGPQDPTGRNSSIWIGPYSTIRTINTYLTALESATGVTEAEVRASQGFARTMKAWQIHRLAIRNGELGIPLDVDRTIDEEPAPFVSFAAAMEAVSDLLDEGLADLQAGSDDFPFTVAPGFGGFDTPATFAEFNRALAAKVLVHRATFVDCAACWDEAEAALAASFIDDAGLPGSLADGVYYAYSSSAGEASNPVSEPLANNRLWVHPSIVTDAQQQMDGSPDFRLQWKAMDAGREREVNNLAATHKPVMYNSATDPASPDLGAWIPWIDNEELLLLRAEVRWHTGDQAGALEDIDRVREHAGALPPTTLTAASSTEDFVTELLYNRLYSLMWAQGTRWIDARRYDRLDELPIDRPGD